MAYARQNYTQKDIELGFRSIDTNLTGGNVGGVRGTQPTPHGEIHGVSDDLLKHPLFAKARVTAGDGPGTHSVMDAVPMQTKLVAVFNSAGMQPYLARVDNGLDASVNVNLTVTPGNADVYKLNKATGVATTTNGAVVAFFVKIRPNSGNKDIPIIQTCVPMTTAFTAGQLNPKKGPSKGFTF